MFTINNQPANSILTPIVLDMKDNTPSEIEQVVLSLYSEDWFNTQTSSLKGNDNRLNHRIRSIRNQNGIGVK